VEPWTTTFLLRGKLYGLQDKDRGRQNDVSDFVASHFWLGAFVTETVLLGWRTRSKKVKFAARATVSSSGDSCRYHLAPVQHTVEDRLVLEARPCGRAKKGQAQWSKGFTVQSQPRSTDIATLSAHSGPPNQSWPAARDPLDNNVNQ